MVLSSCTRSARSITILLSFAWCGTMDEQRAYARRLSAVSHSMIVLAETATDVSLAGVWLQGTTLAIAAASWLLTRPRPRPCTAVLLKTS